MKFSEQQIQQFISLYKRETGQDISPETAREYAKELVGLVESVIKWRQSHNRDPPIQ